MKYVTVLFYIDLLRKKIMLIYEYLYSPGNPVATKKEKNKHTNFIK